MLIQPYPERATAPGVQPLLLAVSADRYLPQREDLAAREPGTLRALHDALQAWLGSERESEPPLDEATAERLRQLGYVR